MLLRVEPDSSVLGASGDCITVTSLGHLTVVNATSDNGQRGQALEITWAGTRRVVPAGDSTAYPATFASHLANGLHTLTVKSGQIEANVQIWLNASPDS